MQKMFFLASIILSGLFYTECYAQTLDSSSSNPPMSREENSKAISKIHSDSQKDLLDQAKQIMKSGPEAVQPPRATDEDNADTNTQTKPTPNPVKPSQPTQPAAPATSYSAPNTGNSTPSATPKTTTPADSSQPYSGFGTGQSSTTPSNNSNSKGSNWNMGY